MPDSNQECGEVEYLLGWLFLRHRSSWLRACRVLLHLAGSPSGNQEYRRGKSRTRNDLLGWRLRRPAPKDGTRQVVTGIPCQTILERSWLSFPCSSSDTTQTDVIFPVEWAHRGQEWPLQFQIPCGRATMSVNFG